MYLYNPLTTINSKPIILFMKKTILLLLLFITLLSCQTITYQRGITELEPNEGFVICKIDINQPGWEAVIYNSDNNKLVGSIKDIWSPSHLSVLKLKEGTYTIKYLRFRDNDMRNEPLQWSVEGETFTVNAGEINTTKELFATISVKDEFD